jgi:predicted peroxiredoxin
MLKRITIAEADRLCKVGTVGLFSSFGALGMENEEIVVETKDGTFLATKDEFEEIPPFFVRLKREWFNNLIY